MEFRLRAKDFKNGTRSKSKPVEFTGSLRINFESFETTHSA